MGILQRFKDIMSSNINALLDRAEDPEKMVDQTLRNLNSDLAKVKAETAGVMADEQKAKRNLDEVNAEIAKMQGYSLLRRINLLLSRHSFSRFMMLLPQML